jgi:hypothetical protein
VNIEPSVIAADLAEAALACFAFERARSLAEWVGDRKELTASGLLRPAAAAKACEALDIPAPAGKLRSASDVPDLMRDWSVARSARFIVPEGKSVYAAADLPDLPRNPDRVLNAWLWAATEPMGLADEPCAQCLIALHTLAAADGPVSIVDVIDAAVSVSGDDEPADEVPCPDCGEVHGLADSDERADDAPDVIQHAMSGISELMAFGALVTTNAVDGGVQLTPLGRMLADSVFGLYTLAADEPAGTAVTVLCEVPAPIASLLIRPWLDARSPETAVRELLGYAASAAVAERVVAISFARSVGPAAAGAWRDWARIPGFGVYARHWLDEQGEPVAADPRDEAWMQVELLSAASTSMPDDLVPVVFGLATQAADSDPDATLAVLRTAGHPDAPWLLQAFATSMSWQGNPEELGSLYGSAGS